MAKTPFLQVEAHLGGYTGFQSLLSELFIFPDDLRILPVRYEGRPDEIINVMKWWPLFERQNPALYGFGTVASLERPPSMRRLIPEVDIPLGRVRDQLCLLRTPCQFCLSNVPASHCLSSIHCSG